MKKSETMQHQRRINTQAMITQLCQHVNQSNNIQDSKEMY